VLYEVAANAEPDEYTKDGRQKKPRSLKGRRLILRRTRLIGGQATLWPSGGTSPL
jgi:hypothetical protein